MCDMNSLKEKLEAQGQSLVGVLLLDGIWTVYAHDPKLAGPKPLLEHCRDAIDYGYLKSAWEKMGRVILFADEDYDKAVSGAIDAVKGS